LLLHEDPSNWVDERTGAIISVKGVINTTLTIPVFKPNSTKYLSE